MHESYLSRQRWSNLTEENYHKNRVETDLNGLDNQQV